jgi:small subunit ribosomal protein S20
MHELLQFDSQFFVTFVSMPNTVSAKKRLRQSVVRRDRNRSIKSSVRTQVRKVRAAVAAGDAEKSATEFATAVKKLDQAAAKKVIHPNAAARTKSRLSKAVKSLKS